MFQLREDGEVITIGQDVSRVFQRGEEIQRLLEVEVHLIGGSADAIA